METGSLKFNRLHTTYENLNFLSQDENSGYRNFYLQVRRELANLLESPDLPEHNGFDRLKNLPPITAITLRKDIETCTEKGPDHYDHLVQTVANKIAHEARSPEAEISRS